MKSLIALSLLLMVCALPACAQNGKTTYSGNGYSIRPWGGLPSPTPTAPGSQNANVGQIPYLNQPGYGYYNRNPYAPGYPAYNGFGGGSVTYGAPVATNGGFFQFGNNRAGIYWKSPSGYYYPWGGVTYGAIAPTIIVQQGESKPAQPPVSDMFKDIRAYLEEQNGKNKFLAEDYSHLNRRLRDIIQKESMFANRNGGSLDPVDEENIRKDLSMLSGDIARRVKP